MKTPSLPLPLALIASLIASLGTPSVATGMQSGTREPCADRNEHRTAYFGDLHVHTARSFDAANDGARATPKDAYAFARGEAIGLPPFDEQGRPSRLVQIDRPLDFMAVTDHAEFFGETALCTTPGSAGYGLPGCPPERKPDEKPDLRSFPLALANPKPKRVESLCLENDNGTDICEEASRDIWREMQHEAAAAYDRSADCSFTSFIGYEYSGAPMGSNIHRNIIFRGAAVPDKPVSYLDRPNPLDMLRDLEETCEDGLDGCAFVSIPHNSNLSNGRMFPPLAGNDEQAIETARLLARSEPIVEIVQHKGHSECANGLVALIGEPDELCDLEQVRQVGGGNELDTSQVGAIFGASLPDATDCENPGTKNVQAFGTANKGCVSSYDFARGALLRGMEEELRTGVNPYNFGFIGSTDTHLGTAGNVTEGNWPGHIGYEATLEGRLSLGFMPTNRLGNPGGLAGVWAEENSREALFDALQRKEVFATSGPRIRPRFFASATFSETICSDPARVAKAYQQGVPMGSAIPAMQKGTPLQLLVFASADNAAWSQPLQKLQVIKGWLDNQAGQHYRVFDVAFAREDGEAELCSVFEDPQFEPTQPAYYYLRVVEMPTLRWDSSQCAAAGDRAPETCKAIGTNVIHEMAWTSPIWYRP